MWLLFATLAGTFYTGESLLQRFLMRDQKDAWAFSFFYSLVGMVVSLPFMLSNPHVPTHIGPWVLASAIGLLIVAHNLLIFRASNFIEVSLMGSLSKLRLVWTFVLGIVFLHVSFSWMRLGGTLLTIAAGLVVVHRFRKPSSTAGISLALSATLFNASIVILTKYLLRDFNAVSLTFFATFLPAVAFNFLLMPHATARIKTLFRSDWRFVLLACGLGSLANLALNQALSLHDASSVLIITEVFLVLVLVGEHLFLKEKEHIWIKIVSVALAVAGASLILVQ